MQAQSADGVIHDFPDGTNMSVIDNVMKLYVATTPQKTDAAPAPAAPDMSAQSEFPTYAAPASGDAAPDNAAHGFGVGVRNVAEGLAGSLPGQAVDALTWPGRALLRAAGAHVTAPSDMVSEGLTEAGVPEAGTSGEKLRGSAISGMASMLPTMGLGSIAALAEKSPALAKAFADGIIGQLTGGAASGVASEGTRQLGGGPVAQTVAGMAGGLVGGVAGTRVPGSDAAPTPKMYGEAFAPDVSQLDSRNAIQALIQHDIDENPVIPSRAPGFGSANQGAEAIAAIGAAPDIDTAIAAASKAAQSPVERPMAQWMQPISAARDENAAGTAGLASRLGAPEASPTTAQTDLATRLGAPANDANATPLQSVGAAASRDMALPGSIPPETPAQIATSLQKMVNQSAEDRVMPGGRDDAVYVPGVERPEAMRDFSPAADGQMSSALAHKALYNTDSAYHDQFDAQVKKNNGVMVDQLGDLMGDANSRDAAMNDAKQLMPGPVGLFDGQKPVDATPIADRINDILSGPAGKRGAVRTQLNNILDNLKDTDGNLEEMPSMLKGIRDDITDKLYDKSPTVEGNAARTARNQLQDVLSVVDDTIASGLPGTKYQDYLTNLSAALGKVSKLDYLQGFLTGPKKLTDLAGNLQFNKVQRMLEDIQSRHADLTGGAKELSADEINQIEAVRNELAAKDLLDRRASVRGSPTAQITNASGVMGSGPLGAGVRGAAEVALHAGLVPLTGGVGNAALLGYRYIMKPAMEAANAQKAAAALAETKQRLLDTTPRPAAP